MSDNNVLNFFEQPATPGTPGDNPLHLGGTVIGASGTQAAFVADATDLTTTTALANTLKAILIDNGMMASS